MLVFASSLSSSFLGTATNALASLSNLSKDWLVLESIGSVGFFMFHPLFFLPRRGGRCFVLVGRFIPLWSFASQFVKGQTLSGDCQGP